MSSDPVELETETCRCICFPEARSLKVCFLSSHLHSLCHVALDFLPPKSREYFPIPQLCIQPHDCFGQGNVSKDNGIQALKSLCVIGKPSGVCGAVLRGAHLLHSGPREQRHPREATRAEPRSASPHAKAEQALTVLEVLGLFVTQRQLTDSGLNFRLVRNKRY